MSTQANSVPTASGDTPAPNDTQQAQSTPPAQQSQEASFDPEKHESSVREYYEKRGYVIIKSSDHQKTIDDAVNKAHSDWEMAVSTVSGVNKPTGVKGIDWAKETIGGIKKSTEGKVPIDEVAKKDSLITALTSRLDNMEQAYKAEQESRITDRINSARRAAIKSLKLNATEEEMAERIADAEALFSQRVELKFLPEDNKVVGYVNGQPVIDTKTNDYMDLGKLAEQKLPWMLVKEDSKPATPTIKGTGVVPPGKETNKNQNNSDIILTTDKNVIFAEAEKRFGADPGNPSYIDFVKRSFEANSLTLY